ncbi:RING-H2 finger protein ATL13 [Eucalyptus grandis]|uniref:RING-H2 finger protein ATL13 n=1 Tax=Eucalyptus grandis TaxID=71139 RepID=UPI0005256C62|nr:RING-H2 finger protein ATL13 [Eucalyptus grandis]
MANDLLSPPPVVHSDIFTLINKVSPTTLLIIIILSIIFFVSGLLHLLMRILLRPPHREVEDTESVTPFQGQLQQLFHLHDCGLDQSIIDNLPVFHYKAIIGLKVDPFDCAVCLCEFEPEDKLRLLPKCSHAFHMECIDTWLLSHSTCPLCRDGLWPDYDFTPNNTCPQPFLLVLESGSESSRETVAADRSTDLAGTSLALRSDSHFSFDGETKFGSSLVDLVGKSRELSARDAVTQTETVDSGERVVSIRLGKFRNADGGESSSTSASNNTLGSRRCFSMGSYEYVTDESSTLLVAIRTPSKKQPSRKPTLPLRPGHHQAMSVCSCESRRDFAGFDATKSGEFSDSKRDFSIWRSKGESFSISRIWARGKKEKPNSRGETSAQAASLQIPNNRAIMSGEAKDKLKGDNCSRASMELELGCSENSESEFGCDQDSKRISLDSQTNMPSFPRRTLLWFLGLGVPQSKVVHSSSSPQV